MEALKVRWMPSVFGSDLMRARFAAKVIVNKATGCHEWTGCLQSNGYGQLRCEGMVDYAHRIAWRLDKGVIPDGLYVLHRCDNRRCVNTDHHFLGTQAENIADMKAKGRRSIEWGGKRKYFTEEERLGAARASRRKYRERQLQLQT